MIFALVGNQNCGKTTLFNALTGANQRVGNFPGVTVEKKMGTVLQTPHRIVDLPGIYALRPFSQEEVLTRNFLLEETPDAIVNIVDAGNPERNLYLTMQLLTLETPMVVVLNMMDEVRKRGGSIDIPRMEKILGVTVVPISAAKKEGLETMVESLVRIAVEKARPQTRLMDNGPVERCIRAVEDCITPGMLSKRFCAERLIEREQEFFDKVKGDRVVVRNRIRQMEAETGLDANAALADMRYRYIEKTVRDCVQKPREQDQSFLIDRIVLGKYTAFPLFFGVLGLIFFLTFHLLGPVLSGWLARSVSGFSQLTDSLLTRWEVHPIVRGLVIDGAFAGVGSALSFLPVILVLFFFLSLLEDSGYMARVAFIMDRPMGCLGLSGRSFVPLLLGFGCTVPAALAARTLPSGRDRRMTVLLTPFMSCSAKIPIYTVAVATFFPGKTMPVICALYGGGMLMGILAAAVMNRAVFPGEAAAFVLELPDYRLPTLKNGAILMWEKAKDFLLRAFTVIFLASVVIWFLRTFDVRFCVTEDPGESILALLGQRLAPLFAPLGFGSWQAVTALAAGFTAKEAVVSTFGVLLGVGPEGLPSALGGLFTPAGALSFLTFTLLYTPCVAAVTAIGRELGSPKRAIDVVAAQCGIAWIAAFLVYRIAVILL